MLLPAFSMLTSATSQKTAVSCNKRFLSSCSGAGCNTTYKFTRFVYKWTIDDFRAGSSSESTMCSAPFRVEFPWKMLWNFKVARNTSSDCFVFSVTLSEGQESPVATIVEFSILNPKYGEDYVTVKAHIFDSNYHAATFSVNRSSILCDPKQMIYNGRLTVRWIISLTNDMTSTISDEPVPNLSKTAWKLSKDFSQMFADESFSDVTLTVGLESFRAHKVVMAARSTVFAAMFKHEMSESTKNRVAIADVEPGVFREVLRFIYTGKIDDRSVLKQMALEMMVVADKYALEDLKELCEEFVMQSMCTEIAAEALIVAELHGAKELKKRAIDFILANMSQVALTEGWFKISAYPDLLKELAAQ